MPAVTQNIEDLAAQIKAAEAEVVADQGEALDLSSLTGLDEAELQTLLESKSGISADEDAQGSVMAAAASVAAHC
ncbi:thioviridamide family RiPP peptide [Nocardiopsis sp. CNT-189]|uniref:thioviridamide family RiPP peptide n=1 Tax=Nocardiopsis oceanisediminis TaxID=2816862 RepID=UPI003B2F4742